jgi:hypothetical protein
MFKQWKNAAAALAVMIGFSGALFGQKVSLAMQKARAEEHEEQVQQFKNNRQGNSHRLELKNNAPLLSPRKLENPAALKRQEEVLERRN